MVDGPDALQVGVAPRRLRRRVVGDWLHVVRPELPFLCGSGFGWCWCRRGSSASASACILGEDYRDANPTQGENPFDHCKTPPGPQINITLLLPGTSIQTP